MRDERYKALIRTLRQRRIELGLTQQAVADRLGLHKQYVSRVELGERRLDVIEFVDFTMALDISPTNAIGSIDPSVKPFPN